MRASPSSKPQTPLGTCEPSTTTETKLSGSGGRKKLWRLMKPREKDKNYFVSNKRMKMP
jgi:hypothetical protein